MKRSARRWCHSESERNPRSGRSWLQKRSQLSAFVGLRTLSTKPQSSNDADHDRVEQWLSRPLPLGEGDRSRCSRAGRDLYGGALSYQRAKLHRTKTLEMSTATKITGVCLSGALLSSCFAYKDQVPSWWRNPGQQCVEVENPLPVTAYRHEDFTGDQLDPWCGMHKSDGHVYCYEWIYGPSVSRLVEEGTLVQVPPGHAELRCWAIEFQTWKEKNYRDPLRAVPWERWVALGANHKRGPAA